MAERKTAKKRTKRPARRTTGRAGKVDKGFTDDERSAMRERARELKAGRGSRAGKADGEEAVLEKIAAMPAADRAKAEKVHAIVKDNAPVIQSDRYKIRGELGHANDPRPFPQTQKHRGQLQSTDERRTTR